MNKFILYFSAIFSVLFFSLSFAQEQLTITTYYPSPYGSYAELRTNQMVVGSTYNNAANLPSANLPANGLMVEGMVKIGSSQTSPSGSLVISNRSGAFSTPQIVFDNNAVGTSTTQALQGDGSFRVVNSGVETLTLKNGNVGIGTASPQNKLDVEGGVAIGSAYSGTNAAPVNGLIVEGNVGIGTNSAGQKLAINGTQSAVVFNLNDAANTAAIEAFNPNNPAEKRPIALNPWGGYVAIGTLDAPQAELDMGTGGGIRLGGKTKTNWPDMDQKSGSLNSDSDSCDDVGHSTFDHAFVVMTGAEQFDKDRGWNLTVTRSSTTGKWKVCLKSIANFDSGTAPVYYNVVFFNYM